MRAAVNGAGFQTETLLIGVILTLSTDLMLFTFTMIRSWDLAGAGTALLLILKVGLDGWTLGRVSERRESFDERVRRAATARLPESG